MLKVNSSVWWREMYPARADKAVGKKDTGDPASLSFYEIMNCQSLARMQSSCHDFAASALEHALLGEKDGRPCQRDWTCFQHVRVSWRGRR